MNKNTSGVYKLESIDILVILGIVLQGAGTFGFLPLNIAQLIILLCGVLLIIPWNRSKVKINKIEIILLLYMAIITFVGKFDFECVKGFVFFSIQLIILGVYYRSNRDLKKICYIVYLAALILAIYGLVQEVGYILNISALYDISLYGFTKNGEYITSFGMIRVMSLYAEPSELSTIFSAGFLIGITGVNNKYVFCTRRKNAIILLSAFLTASFVVYVSMLVVIVYYIAVYQKHLLKKLVWVVGGLVALALVISFVPGITEIITEKVISLKSGSSTQTKDLSAFALYSNIKVAFEKLKDGYIFGTGYDTHRLYYFKYIDSLYLSVVMYANVDEASSLYTRIFSEFGIVGLGGYLYFIISRFHDYTKRKNFLLQIFVIVLFISGIRNGHYTDILKMLSFSIVLNNKAQNYRRGRFVSQADNNSLAEILQQGEQNE